MQKKFETCLNNLRKKQDKIVGQNVSHSFFLAANNKQLKPLNDFLTHLVDYKLNTFDLIEKNPENKLFYEAHFNAVVNLLEKLDSTNGLSELKDEDYSLVVDAKYHLNSDEIKEYVNHYAMIGGIIGAAIGYLVWSICLITASLPFHPLALLVVPIMLGYLATFVSVCAALGAMIGMIIGECAAPYMDAPLTGNSYDKAFDLSLLKDAYRVISTEYQNPNYETSEYNLI